MPFAELGLSEPIAHAAANAGYTSATSIQTSAIPVLLEGRDLVGCSQTGTGKTAAFAMPLLQRIDLALTAPQVLVLTPTRELATQVADSFRDYGAKLNELQVLAIFGGAPYGPQLSALRRGVHVVVGTPGRVMDHLKQTTLDLSQIRAIVLDEADEMLQMGFIEDVQWILSQAPEERQIALFSATMPEPIRKLAQKYLRNPVELNSGVARRSADTITQQYMIVPNRTKIEALARVLEVDSPDGVIVFVRTRAASLDVAERLTARGFNTAALNGDIVQSQRLRTVTQLKRGEIDILVATDVAARGLDVDRVSHVVNFDLPREHEAYVHRIGRTGRAGRTGKAISLVTPADARKIQHLSRAIGQPIEQVDPPSAKVLSHFRTERFKQRLLAATAQSEFTRFTSLVRRISEETGTSIEHLAAAAALLAHESRPLFTESKELESSRIQSVTSTKEAPSNAESAKALPEGRVKRSREARWQAYRVEVGRNHGLLPKNLVGAIANEAGIDGRNIGRIEILDQYSIVDLPVDLSDSVVATLRSVQVSGRDLRIAPTTMAPRSYIEKGAKPYSSSKPKKRATVSKLRQSNARSGAGDTRSSNTKGGRRRSFSPPNAK